MENDFSLTVSGDAVRSRVVTESAGGRTLQRSVIIGIVLEVTRVKDCRKASPPNAVPRMRRKEKDIYATTIRSYSWPDAAGKRTHSV